MPSQGTIGLPPAERLALAEAIDRLVTVDIPGRGFVERAYPAARTRTGKPLVMDAGDRLLEVLGGRPQRAVLIATGATSQRPGLPDHVGEMDGPPGALVLARCLALAFHALPVLVTDPGQEGMLSAAARSIGFYTFPWDDLRLQAERMPHVSAVTAVELPDDDAKAAETADALLRSCRPAALVAIEKAGKNERGVYHNSYKVDTSPCKARTERLFAACAREGIVTIGIGDGGNEVGMGNIREEIISAFPHMARCNCPCEGSIVAAQGSDSLMVTTVSNWGGYGLATYLAAAVGKPYAGHAPGRERTLLRGCAAAGYMNLDGFCVPAADGLPENVHVALVQMLACLVHWPPLRYGRAGVLADMMAP